MKGNKAMKIKKYLLTGLSFVLVAAVAIGGTLAYLTSQDSDVNVMTLGNVDIEQIEQERDANIRKNSIWSRKYYLAALTDATKAVKITLSA